MRAMADLHLQTETSTLATFDKVNRMDKDFISNSMVQPMMDSGQMACVKEMAKRSCLMVPVMRANFRMD